MALSRETSKNVVSTDTRRGDVFAVFIAIAKRMRCGKLTLVLPDGSVHRFEGPDAGPDAELRIHRSRVARRFLFGGANGFSDSYLDGDWDSPALASLLELLALNEDAFAQAYYGKPWYRALKRLGHMLKPNTRRGSKRNIHAHYDLGNRFYAEWLDESMTYSAALFDDPEHQLASAQACKYASILDQLSPAPGAHLLEIGCGWGGFAEYAAKTADARVTAVTISTQQHAFASERIQKAGLADKVTIELRDYRDIEGRFDGVASIEMFEAVGEVYWPVFFDKLRGSLATGGRAALQIITIAERNYDSYRRGADFIQRYIFPGGMLPSVSALDREFAKAGLTKVAERAFALGYARTLAEWNERFQAAWPRIRPLGFDDRFKRIWEYYLAYCEAGFRTANIDVVQVALAR